MSTTEHAGSGRPTTGSAARVAGTGASAAARAASPGGADPSGHSPTPARAGRLPAPVALALVLGAPLALLVLAVAVTATGASAPSPVGDPGALVRWALPAARVVGDLAVSAALGSLALLALAVPSGTAAWQRASRLAAGAAAAWVVASCVQLVLGYADVAGEHLGSAGLGSHLGYYLLHVPPGQVALATTIAAVVAGTAAAVGVRTATGAGVGAALTVLALVPPALASHASSTGDHHTAVTGWWLHGVGVGAWLGGLVALAAVGPLLGSSLGVVARRYSTLALGAYALVVVSGLATGWVQVGERLGDLRSGYGALLGVKVAAAVVLGGAGWAHRRWALTRLADGLTAAFWRLVAVELAVMALAVGVAVALVRTGPPTSVTARAPSSLAEQVTSEPVPPLPATIGRLLSQPRPDLLWLVVAVGLGGAYVAGVVRLRRRGDAWSPGRTASWLVGCAVLAWVTSFGAAAYMDLLFSAHMVVHMVVMSVVPPLLVAGAPVTLALRALKRRTDGSRGPREWVLLVVHSRWSRVVTHPVVAAVLFAGSLVVFYESGLFDVALRTHVGHELMLVHFLAVGYLFASVVVGVDPGVATASFPLRLVLLLATMAFHALFFVSMMSSSTLLAAGWFSSLGLGVDALADQRTGAGIAWGLGELPTLSLAVVLAVQWSRSDDREARRRDRAADRDGDAELTAYNAMLAARATRPGAGAPSEGPGRQEP